MLKAAQISPPHVGFRNVMATSEHTARNPRKIDLDILSPDINKSDVISAIPRICDDA